MLKWVESRWDGVEPSWLCRNTPKVWARVQPLPVQAEMGLESTNKGGRTFDAGSCVALHFFSHHRVKFVGCDCGG